VEEIRELIANSLKKVEKWVEGHDYKGYEPFDGLSSFFRPLTFGNLFLDRILLQLVRQSPVNLRPLLGIKALDSTIGRGYMAWGYLTLLRSGGNEEYARKAKNCLEWLIENKSPGYQEFSWGKHFDFASRGGLCKAFEPILIWSALIGHAFLDAYEIFKEGRYLETCESLCTWILKLPRNKTDPGFCLGYSKDEINGTIHNSNIVGAAVLARTAKHSGKQEYLDVAKGAMRYSCARQLPNGAWFYGEDPKYHWVDNFHTGYNLDGLKCYMESSRDSEFEDNLNRGIEFYKRNFFEENGRPKYYHNRAYPIDSQCIAQSIDSLANFAENDQESLTMAMKVARWAIDNMQDKEGYFYYRQYPFMEAKTPMLHWAQATTYKALAVLLSKLEPGHMKVRSAP